MMSVNAFYVFCYGHYLSIKMFDMIILKDRYDFMTINILYFNQNAFSSFCLVEETMEKINELKLKISQAEEDKSEYLFRSAQLSS